MYIRWSGYRIMWVKDMHLHEILPQTRNRMLLIAILDDEPLHPHRCAEWSRVEAYTLQSYKALFLLNETWMKHAMPDPSTLDMYLDPALLPGMRGHFGVANKKCKRDVEAYRIRLPHGIASCIMANYSFSHLLPKHVIERKGLFGSLILSAQGIRFFALPELIALFGTTNPLILPKNIRKAIHIVGNCIAVPHAVLAVANAAAFYMPSLSQVDVQELVHKVHALRLHPDNMIALEGELSFSFQKRVEIGISPTQPLHSFHYIRITSPLEEFVLECEVGVGIIEAVKILTGPSFPAELFIVFDHQPTARIYVPDDMTMAEHDLHLQANVPNVLMINEEYITNEVVSSTCVVVLFPEKTVVYMRQKDMTCGDVVELINCTHEDEEPHFILNLMGLKLSDGSICPTCVFAVYHLIQWQDMSILNMIKIETCKQMMRFSGSGQALKDTLELFHKTGTTQMLHALGWHFVSVFDTEGNLQMDSIILIRRTATFNAMIPDITMFIMSRFFILGLNQANLFPTSDDPGIQVYLKLWGSWIWQGLIPPQASLVPIEMIWIGLALCFKCEMDIRFILHGRQINPEYPLSAYASSDQVVKIFATMSLKGGAGRTDQYIDLTSHDHDSLSGPSDASDARAQLASLEAFDYDRAIAAIVTHWVGNRGLFFGHQLDEILLLRYSEEDGMICYEGPMRSIMSFLQLMQDLKMVDEIENLGWIIAVQFVECYSPVVTRLVFFPRPALEVVSTKIIQSFLHVGLFFAALPTPTPSTSCSVITRIKVWGVVVYHERLPFDCKVHHIVDAWDLACDMVSVPIPITVICRGRRLNPDFPLGEYVRQNEDGNYVANLHLVVSLRGGGNQKDFAIMQKNALATFLLSEGGDLSEVATFTDSVIKGAGPQAVAAVLSLKSKSAKWDGVKKLGDTLQLTWPNFIKKKLDRKVAVDNKFRKDAASLREDLHLPDIKIKDSFFLNEDDSACPQITTMMPSTTGVCLLKASEAEEWLKKTGTFSQDELAIIVIGPCPCTESSKCHRLQFPAFDATSQPIVMTGCMHNVGRKHVKVGLTNDAKIKIDDTVVVSWTIYRDEVGEETWESIQQAPVKTTIDLALGNQPEVSFIGPPWGRSFQKDKKKCSPNEATSLQFHSRINQDALTKILRISGMHGIYTTQKTEYKQISNAYQIVWVQLSSVDLIVHHIVDAWDLACDMVSVPIPITVICRGRRLNPDFPLGEYVRQNEDGNYVANLHLVVSLRGGGNQKDFAIMQKNALATFLLSEGGDLSEVATFTDSVIKGAGPQAVAAVLSLKSKSAKWDGVKKLGDTLQLTWPNFIKKKLDRKVAVDNKFRKDAASLWEDLHLPDIKIKDSFFLNEDDSACPQITTMMPSTTGVCLLKASEAEEWLKKTGTFSQDELAIIVIGPCPCTEPSKCHRLQFPAFDATSQPIVMTGCMHNVGRKHVKVGLTNDAKIKIDDTVVVSWTIYRDEVGEETWESIQQAPVKTTIDLALGNQPEVSFIGPPWGRYFQKDKKKCSPNEATSLQFHSRINQDALTKILRISGMHGIYTTQKTEHKQIPNAYQIVWVQLSSVGLIVTASTFPNHCGIVRNTKYDGKLSKGIRFLKGDFEEAFKQLKPGIDVPSLITPNYTYKITPVPLGATFDHIQKWLDLQKWKAKPVRSLSNQVWIVAADAPIEEQFAQWNGETLLVKPILPRRDRQPVIVAGAIPKPKVHDVNLGKTLLKEDPWERYRALNPTSHGSTPVPSIISQPVQRKIEGPIETKFEQQQLEIQTLKDSAKEMQVLKQDITEIQKALQVQSKNHDALRQDVTVECQKIRHETKEQMKTLSDTFQESLAQSLAQQDRQLMRQFDDLKELLQRPGAAKKAKATPPEHQEDQMDQAL
eukprot:symbB.v1.2.016388.t1/scaffold1246.1/size129174/5